MSKYIWSISNTQKIKTREIREYKVNCDVEKFFVTVHGFGFGHGITIFEAKTQQECIDFINEMTGEEEK